MYTKDQRREIYLLAAENVSIVDSQYTGACFEISAITKEDSVYDNTSCFHELSLFNPKIQNEGYWFKGKDRNKQRIIMLLLCAEMCKD